MPLYKYSAKNTRGRGVNGQLEAQDRISAIAEIKRMNLIPVKLEETTAAPSKIKINEFSEKELYKHKINKKKLSFILGQFSVMLKAGVSLPLAMEVLIGQEKDKRVRTILMLVNKDMLSGSPLSKSMGRFRAFPPLIINMIAAGETNGRLDNAFERAASNLEKELELTGKIKNAMIYPIFLLVLVTAIVIFLNMWLLPEFVKIFRQLNVELPLFTKIVLGISSFMRSFWYLLLSGIGLVIFLYHFLRYKVDKFKIKTDYIKLRLPILGKLLKQTLTARFCRILESLIDAGVEVVSSLQIACDVTTNRYLQTEIQKAIDKVKLGIPINNAMSMLPIFPPLLVSMVRVGEESGSLGEVLGKMAGIYEAETDTSTKRMTSLMEPAMTVIIAVIVATIILAVMLPMFSIYSTISDTGI